jgi:Tfp pilus assembly pilus retraction ATPase PilT
MQTMDHSIADMYKKGYIEREEAIIRSTNPGKMSKTLDTIDQEKQPAAAGKK